ncbi:hypothetical protein Tco_1187869, partial [Tanacetum coccineum]
SSGYGVFALLVMDASCEVRARIRRITWNEYDFAQLLSRDEYSIISLARITSPPLKIRSNKSKKKIEVNAAAEDNAD